jgi:hypothetical protein
MHPCFVGTANELIQDCCGECPPVPNTDVARLQYSPRKTARNTFRARFLMDDPGRQEIGSFNPITDDDWTNMAYKNAGVDKAMRVWG